MNTLNKKGIVYKMHKTEVIKLGVAMAELRYLIGR